jgi:ABC-2 type transport system permease protein
MADEGGHGVIRAYRSLFVMEARRLFAYRLGAIVGWIGGGAYLISALAVWHALLEQGSIGGYDWTTMKGYLLVSWATGVIGSASGDWRMADRILWGEVATDLTRPIDYQKARFAEQCGGLVMEVSAIGVAVAAASVYLGQVSGVQALQAIAVQAGWVVLLWFAARLLWRGALRALTIHGG